ncbi:MAG TPA: DUF3662 domain-containing protein [Tepidiformaceae bacterium]|nr:DUF3662 domain-containing protein [Tepidiformaceae bacterium]
MSQEQPRIERFLEQAARAVSGTQLHPVAVLQQVQAAAESGIRDGSMPNRFRILASASDHSRLTRIERQLRVGIERMLDELVLRSGTARIGEWLVEFGVSPTVTAGDVRVEASFAEIAHRDEAATTAPARPTEVITRLSGLALGLPDGSQVPLTHAPFFIGRAPGCDLVVPDLSVSRRHAAVRVEDDGSLALHDLDSRNGGTVEGARGSAVRLERGTRFTLGEISFELQDRE